jgi:hypothetical protein
MQKRPYLYNIVKALLKRSKIKHACQLNPYTIRIDELQGLPVLFFNFDKEFSGYVSVYDVDKLSWFFGFYAPNVSTVLKKLFRFRLLNSKQLKRFVA